MRIFSPGKLTVMQIRIRVTEGLLDPDLPTSKKSSFCNHKGTTLTIFPSIFCLVIIIHKSNIFPLNFCTDFLLLAVPNTDLVPSRYVKLSVRFEHQLKTTNLLPQGPAVLRFLAEGRPSASESESDSPPGSSGSSESESKSAKKDKITKYKKTKQ